MSTQGNSALITSVKAMPCSTSVTSSIDNSI